MPSSSIHGILVLIILLLVTIPALTTKILFLLVIFNIISKIFRTVLLN